MAWPPNGSASAEDSWGEGMERYLKELLARQSAWQRSRAALPWAEKIRLAKVMIEVQRALRAGFDDRRELEKPSR